MKGERKKGGGTGKGKQTCRRWYHEWRGGNMKGRGNIQVKWRGGRKTVVWNSTGGIRSSLKKGQGCSHQKTPVLISLIFISILIFVSMTLPIIEPVQGEEERTVKLTHPGLQPGSGTDGTTFLFTIKATGSAEPASPIEVVINDRGYMMNEVNNDDANYSDGKDFYHRQRLSQGGTVYFFRSGNTTTTARILSVGESDRIQYHYDVALIMSLLVIPVIVGILLFRRIEREFHEIAMSLGDVGVVGDPDKKSEDK